MDPKPCRDGKNGNIDSHFDQGLHLYEQMILGKKSSFRRGEHFGLPMRNRNQNSRNRSNLFDLRLGPVFGIFVSIPHPKDKEGSE